VRAIAHREEKVKLKSYESVLILNAALEDEQIENSLQKVTESIKTYGGEIQNVDNWGRKRLAYPIKKSKSGYYSVIRFVAPTESVARIERNYRLDETIIRFITVELTKEALEYYQTQKDKLSTDNAEAAEGEVAQNNETVKKESQE